MTSRSAKNKGRRLQVFIAEYLARYLHLTIVATPPTRPGARNGARYVGEHAGGDLLIRRIGVPGADVALLSRKAQEAVALRRTGQPFWIEAKNVEAGWDFGAKFFASGTVALIDRAFLQTDKARPPSWMPLIVLARNRFPPLAVFKPGGAETRIGPRIVSEGGWIAVPFDAFVHGLL